MKQRSPVEELTIHRIVGHNIRAQRQALQLTVQEASQRAALHGTHWQKIEAGRGNVTLLTLSKLSIALGVEVCALLRKPPRGHSV